MNSGKKIKGMLMIIKLFLTMTVVLIGIAIAFYYFLSRVSPI
jgi:flagellar basal body-associated protein FliL